MKRVVLVIVVLAVLGGGGFAAYHFIASPSKEQVEKMYWAVRDGKVEEINRLLAENPRLAKARYKKEHSMLITAACTYSPIPNQTEVSRILLAHGADPNEDHGQPLHGAIYCWNTDLIRLLLQHGADPHITGGKSERSQYEHAKWRDMADVIKIFDEHGK